MMTRRSLILGLSALPFAPAFAADPLLATLEAVGPLDATQFDPARALEALRLLHALGPTGAREALRQYLQQRPDPPDGLFIVLRCLFSPPPLSAPASPWPGAVQPGHLRPPALGAPYPPQPDDLTLTPHFPAFILGDVPMSLVTGYALGGLAEPLSMHLDALANATWRAEPLRPKSAGEVRYLLDHWGLWAGTPVSALLEGQLDRLGT
jgi:hypothetical protein